MIFHVTQNNPIIDPRMMLANSLMAIDPETFKRRRLILGADNIPHEAYTEFTDFVSACESAVFIYSDPDSIYTELTLSDEIENASELCILDGETTICKIDIAPRVEKKTEAVPAPVKIVRTLKNINVLKCCSFDKEDCVKIAKRSLVVAGIVGAIVIVVAVLRSIDD